MNLNLTILERMILESLQLKASHADRLSELTSINKTIIDKITQDLICRNILNLTKEGFKINSHLSQSIKNELEDKQGLICEINEVIHACVRDRVCENNESSFKMKKVNMNEREFKIYKGLLYNLESFVNSLHKNENVKEQKIIFWGEGQYEDIKNNILSF